MKISNSKKQLAKIIHENGGWRDGAESAAQCIKGEISFWHDVATKRRGEDWCGSYLGSCEGIEFTGVKLPNWHQTVLSRDEYFHLYPAPDADGWIEWNGGECPVEKGTLVDVIRRDGTERAGVKALHLGGAGHQFWVADGMVNDIIAYRLHKPVAEPVKVVVENKTTCHLIVADKPTIEQLAADYHNRKDYADRKQQEADAAKADAEVKLAELVAAGKALGLVLSVAGAEPELVITDWRDLRVGDRIWVGDSGRSRNCPEGEYEIAAIDRRDSDQPVGLAWPGGLTDVTWPQIHKRGWRFIRRPAKGGADA